MQGSVSFLQIFSTNHSSRYSQMKQISMVLIMSLTVIVICSRGESSIDSYTYIQVNKITLFRLLWLKLVILFICFTISICYDQMNRFLDSPISVSLEKDYRNWKYRPMAITICTDFINDTSVNQFIERFANVSDEYDSKTSYDEYKSFFEMIGALNVENIDLINQFESIDSVKNFTGDDLLFIAIEVICYLCIN